MHDLLCIVHVLETGRVKSLKRSLLSLPLCSYFFSVYVIFGFVSDVSRCRICNFSLLMIHTFICASRFSRWRRGPIDEICEINPLSLVSAETRDKKVETIFRADRRICWRNLQTSISALVGRWKIKVSVLARRLHQNWNASLSTFENLLNENRRSFLISFAENH